MLAAVLLLAQLTHIENAGTCPLNEQVEAALAPLSSGNGSSEPEYLRLVVEGEQLLIEFMSPDGRILAQKRVPLNEDCEVLAQVVAVTVASFRTEFNSDWALPPDPPPTEPKPHPKESVGAGSEQPPSEAKNAAPVPSDVEKNLWQGEAWGAIGGLVDSNDVFLGGHLGLGARYRAFGVGVELRLEQSRELELVGGSVHYSRPRVALLGSGRHNLGSLDLEGGLGPALALVHVSGESYATNGTSAKLAFGVETYARALFLHGRIRPFLAGQFSFWTNPHVAVVETPDGPEVAELPSWGTGLSAGLELEF